MPTYRGEDGKLYIHSQSFNYTFFSSLVKQIGQNEFVKRYRVNRQVFHDMKEKKPVEYELILKLCRMNNDVMIADFVNDYVEELYEDMDLDLKQFTPTHADINETMKQCKLRMATIKGLLDNAELCAEKRQKIFETIERLILESQYLGVQLTQSKQEQKVVNKVMQLRTERGICKR